MVTGIGAPFSNFWVCALNALQNSMMLRPRWPSAGPIGGDGLAAPAGTCNFRNPVTFFAISHSVGGADLDGWRPPHLPPLLHLWPKRAWPRGRLKLLHLTKFQFNGRSAAEDRHGHLHARTRLVDFLHNAVERSEWTVGHTDLFANLERYRRLRPLDTFLYLMENAVGFGV